MELMSINIPKDDAWDVINALGRMNVAHFVNLNKGE
jgi:hypothetical protein